MDAISLGPFVLSFERFTAFASLAALVLIAELMARQVDKDTEQSDKRLATWASNVVLVILLSARVGFVVIHSQIYLQQPLTALYFWQGGFSALSGIAGGAFYSLWFYRQNLKERKLKDMRWIIAPSIAGLAVYLGLFGFSSTRTQAITELPNLNLKTMTSESINLKSFADQATIVNLWATWCGPCQRELPMMAKTEKEHPNIHFVFIDQQESANKVAAYLKERDLNLNNSLLDSTGQSANTFRLKGTPTTLFFDKDGQLIKRHVGEISRAALESQIAKMQ